VTERRFTPPWSVVHASGLIINLSGHLLIAVPISPSTRETVVGRVKRLGRSVQILRYLLASCVWLGWMYLMAIINDALFAIFLGSSMIIGGIYIPPRSARDPASA
jgi:hypothetical protein